MQGAPERLTASLGEMHYGAMSLEDQTVQPAATVRRSTLLIIIAGAMSVAVFAFGAGQATATAPLSTINGLSSNKLPGDDHNDAKRPDCMCAQVGGNCMPVGKTDVDGKAMPGIELYGQCRLDGQPGANGELFHGVPVTTCIGIDWTEAYEASGQWWAHCGIVQGSNECSGFPCRNGGYCVDEAGSPGYKCDCTWGFQGTHCDTDKDECAFREEKEVGGEEKIPVCHEYASCQNRRGSLGYSCTCQPGFIGDGYARDQTKVDYGAVLTTHYLYDKTELMYGWLDRTEDKKPEFWTDFGAPEQAPLVEYDSNHDGQLDLWGCTDVNDCASDPCVHGQCYDLWEGAFHDADGKFATNPEYAHKMSNAFACHCGAEMPQTSWVGDFCEQNVDECEGGSNNCAINAECEDTPGSFKCHCDAFWEGDGRTVTNDRPTPKDWASSKAKFYGCIDIDDCMKVSSKDVDADGDGIDDVTITTPCENGSTCSQNGDGTGDFLCTCVTGWEDKTCGKDIDECTEFNDSELGCDVNANCVNTPGSWECRCNNGWTGEGDEECWDADDCEFSPCAHGGTCVDCGTLCLICDCIVGWRGKTCETDWNECKMGIHTCHDMAICDNVPGSFMCTCEPGYSGDGYRMCNEVDDCMRWEDDPNRDDAKLIDYAVKTFDETGKLIVKEQLVENASWADDFEIMVPGKYTGACALDEAVGTPGCECAKFPGEGFVKSCTGHNANKAPVTKKCSEAPIGSCDACVGNCDLVAVHQCGEWVPAKREWTEHGSCEDVGAAAFVCTCDIGWSDSNCDLDIDECARSTDSCHKYADCINLPGSFVCTCKLGYTGDGVLACTDIDDCSVGPHSGCKAGKCTDLGPEDFRCVCNQGWEDRLCDLDIDECASFTHTCTPANAKGTDVAICKNTPGSFRCACRVGFTGDGIGPEGCDDIDECGSAPCENGLCQDLGVLSYGCVCDEGWMDTNCDHDFNECIDGSHDCHPAGKCVNTPGGYYCRCVSGHTGDGYTCTDLDDCDPDPCDPIHGTCNDNGANKYACSCEIGFAGMGCEQDEVECMLGTHLCHANAKCFNTYGSYICACADEFYGDGLDCAPCTDCGAECGDNEDRDPTGYACGHGSGYERDTKKPPCAAVDRTCININECMRGLDDCDQYADCKDNEGSFVCQCRIVDEFWGVGVEDGCYKCTTCELGKHMQDDCTHSTDRTCMANIYDGNYAIETFSGDTAQCLVHWSEAGKIFPERYSWGGRLGSPLNEEGTGLGSQSIGKYEMWGGGGGKSVSDSGVDMTSVLPPPDVCDDGNHPICGVCNYSHKSPAQNIVQGMEAVWTFLHLELDLYLIMNAADGMGFRCLGFQTPGSPYPMSIAWKGELVEQPTGLCHTEEDKLPLVADKPFKKKCEENTDCGVKQHCFKAMAETGEWRTDVKGPSTTKGLTNCLSTSLEEQPTISHVLGGGTMRNSKKNKAMCELAYFCGFKDTEFGAAKEKLMSNLGTVWNVAPLGCVDGPGFGQGYCEHRYVEDKYMIRTLATGDVNADNIVDDKDYRCLYFKQAIPEMVPAAPTESGVWLGIGGDADADGDGDPNCGIALVADQQKRWLGAGFSGERIEQKDTQERELLLNHQAVFKLYRLPDF